MTVGPLTVATTALLTFACHPTPAELRRYCSGLRAGRSTAVEVRSSPRCDQGRSGSRPVSDERILPALASEAPADRGGTEPWPVVLAAHRGNWSKVLAVFRASLIGDEFETQRVPRAAIAAAAVGQLGREHCSSLVRAAVESPEQFRWLGLALSSWCGDVGVAPLRQELRRRSGLEQAYLLAALSAVSPGQFAPELAAMIRRMNSHELAALVFRAGAQLPLGWDVIVPAIAQRVADGTDRWTEAALVLATLRLRARSPDLADTQLLASLDRFSSFQDWGLAVLSESSNAASLAAISPRLLERCALERRNRSRGVLSRLEDTLTAADFIWVAFGPTPGLELSEGQFLVVGPTQVAYVCPGSPAQIAGLRVGDILGIRRPDGAGGEWVQRGRALIWIPRLQAWAPASAPNTSRGRRAD